MIQGDSWAEAADQTASQIVRDFAERTNFGVVTAGATSYAPIMMTIQLEIIRQKFNIKPNVVIAIIDQTDIGDTMCRYQDYYRGKIDFDAKLQRWGPSVQRVERAKNILSSHSNLYKLLLNAWFNFRDRVQRHEVVDQRAESWSCIVSPLAQGVSDDARRIFLQTLDSYTQAVFRDSRVRRLYLVTHPHMRHVSGTYVGDVSELVREYVPSSNYKSRVVHIDMSDRFEDLYRDVEYPIFIKTDPASHLTARAYQEIFYPEILSTLERAAE